MTRTDVVEFVARYPADHAHAGQVIGRKAKCTCGREFKQFKINPKWLEALRPGARASYLKSCEVRGDEAFQPPHCPECERTRVNIPRPASERP